MKKSNSVFTIGSITLSVIVILFVISSDASQASKVLSIHQINAQKPTQGIFVTQGYR